MKWVVRGNKQRIFFNIHPRLTVCGRPKARLLRGRQPFKSGSHCNQN